MDAAICAARLPESMDEFEIWFEKRNEHVVQCRRGTFILQKVWIGDDRAECSDPSWYEIA